MGLEGMVAKRRSSLYEAGDRSGAWLKIKHIQAQEFVVGGYTEGSGARSASFGALLLGYYEGDRLTYAGKVGSGFDQSALKALKGSLDDLSSDRSPFAGGPDIEDKEPLWVSPELVAQVKFAEWTAEGRLRAPVFLGLRPEVRPHAVVREKADTSYSAGPTGQEAHDGTEQDSASEVLEQLAGAEDQLILDVGGDRIRLTNLNKEFWPEVDGCLAITKRHMVRYYARVGPALLPHLRDRPLTLTRYPNGILGESFYQKHWEHEMPGFVETVRLYSSHNEVDVEYIMVNNLATLLWLAQLADLELHPWLSRTAQAPDAAHLTTAFTGSEQAIKGSVLSYPDFVVFDLDPYIYSGKEKTGEEPELNRRAFAKAREVALSLKDILDELSLSSFPKTSGKTGLHIYVPVLRHYDYSVSRKTCELIGRFLMQSRPNDVTMEWSVSKRSGKIFLDHNQNVRGKNMASVYSLRPLPGAPVSTPVRWDELGDIYPTDFTIETVPERIEHMGDLWSDMLGAKHDLRRLLESE
jgi:bifunctional non-homologous end joining protein LigD